MHNNAIKLRILKKIPPFSQVKVEKISEKIGYSLKWNPFRPHCKFFLVQTLGALQSPAKGDLGLMDVSA